MLIVQMNKRENRMKNVNIGDTVYFNEVWSDYVIRGKVTELYDEGVSISCYCTVDEKGNYVDEVCYTSGARFTKIYSTAQEAYSAKDRQHMKIISKYEINIKDVQSLLRFALEHCLTGEEYTDYEAREVYIKKAKELLNVDLEL